MYRFIVLVSAFLIVGCCDEETQVEETGHESTFAYYPPCSMCGGAVLGLGYGEDFCAGEEDKYLNMRNCFISYGLDNQNWCDKTVGSQPFPSDCLTKMSEPGHACYEATASCLDL